MLARLQRKDLVAVLRLLASPAVSDTQGLETAEATMLLCTDSHELSACAGHAENAVMRKSSHARPLACTMLESPGMLEAGPALSN